MATRGKKPGKDLTDLKARLGLTKSLTKKEEPVPEPAPQPAPQPVAHHPGAAPGQPYAGQPYQGQPQQGPPGHQQQPYAGQPYPNQPQPGRPPYGGPPPGMVRPQPKPKEAEKPSWTPPPSDPTAATDVPVVAHQSPIQKFGPFAVAIGVGLLFGVIGFLFGGAQSQRDLYNAQSRDATRVLELVQPKLKLIEKIKAEVDKDPGVAPNPKLLSTISKGDYMIEPEALAAQHLLLGRSITSDLLKLTSDSKLLFNMIRLHVAMSTKVDKKELEELAKNTETLAAAGFAIIFDSDSYIKSINAKGDFRPAAGKLVVFDKQEPIVKNEEKYIKVRYPSSGKELEVPLKSMIMVTKGELLRSTGPNALGRYKRRHAEIRAHLKQMDQYMGPLLDGLSKLSERDSAPLLSTGSEG